MKTEFSLAQLADPDIAEADKILRACVHCGFCTATCPTYVLLGDELDSPRGRIYLIKEMLEKDRPLTERALRAILAFVLPRPDLFRASMIMARFVRPFAALLPASNAAATPGL